MSCSHDQMGMCSACTPPGLHACHALPCLWSEESLRAEIERLKAEIQKLAYYITVNHNREIINDGACGTAIQIIDRLKKQAQDCCDVSMKQQEVLNEVLKENAALKRRLEAAEKVIEVAKAEAIEFNEATDDFCEALAAYDALTKEAKE